MEEIWQKGRVMLSQAAEPPVATSRPFFFVFFSFLKVLLFVCFFIFLSVSRGVLCFFLLFKGCNLCC